MEGVPLRDGNTDHEPPTSAAWERTNTVFTNEKAGMKGFDKDKVKKIIYEMSKDSPHFRNEERKQQHTQEKIKRLLKQASMLSSHELAGHKRKTDAKISALLADRDLSRIWIHVDLDAFFASVEELSDPSLKTKPMGVGGLGMLSTANYVARRYGIRSAMPGFIAKRLCPELVFVKPDFSKYSSASKMVQAIFREYDQDMDAASLDEAYMDVTDFCEERSLSGAEVAADIRSRVLAETGLTCSCGVAPNRMLAKVCSDVNKPNGQCVIPADPNEIRRFVDELPIRKVPGIGKVGEQELKALEVTQCSHLIEKRDLLSALFSEIAVEAYLSAGLGLGRTRHSDPLREGEVGRKGKGVERTFTPISAAHELEAKCCELAAKLAGDLEREGLKAKTLTLKLKPPTFEVRTRAVTLGRFISTEEEIKAAALKLLRAELPIEVRLMGLRMSTFFQCPSDPGQQSLQTFIRPASPGEAQPRDAKSQEHLHLPDEQNSNDGPSIGEATYEQNRGTDWQPEDDRSQCNEAGLSQRLHPAQIATGQHRKTWECELCTFADNPFLHLRCLVCDHLRGTTWASMGMPACDAQQANAKRHPGQLVKGGSNQRSSAGQSLPSGQSHTVLKHGNRQKAVLKGDDPKGRKRKAASVSITSFFKPSDI